MAAYPGIQFRHSPIRTYSANAQTGFVGAQDVIGRRGVLPTFTDANTYFISKATGNDSNAGTKAAPKKTINSLFDTVWDQVTDHSANAFHLTGNVPFRYKEDYPRPKHGNYNIGPFSDTQFFYVPAGLLAAMAGLASFSIEAYVFITPQAAGVKNFLFGTPSSATNIYCQIDESMKPSFRYKGNLITGAALTARKWYHIAFVISGSNQYIYVDGKIVASGSSGSAVTTITNMCIGKNMTTAGEYARLLVNRVIFKNTATASFPTPIAETGILARYEFQTDPLFHNKTYACVLDSETYYESIDNSNFSDNYPTPIKIFAADGEAPILQPWRGAIPETYGASPTRCSYTLPADTGCAFLSKAGNDGTGTVGDRSKPYLTLQAAATASTNGTVICLDSGIYTENVDTFATSIFGKLYADKSLGANPVFMPADTTATAKHFYVAPNVYPTIKRMYFYGVTLNGRTVGATASCALINGSSNDITFTDCNIIGYKDIVTDGPSTSTIDIEVENCYIDTFYQTNVSFKPAFFGSNNFYTSQDSALCKFGMYYVNRNWTLANVGLEVTMLSGGNRYAVTEGYIFGSMFSGCSGDISGTASYWHAIADTTFYQCSLSLEKTMTTAATTFFRYNNCLADSATGNGFNFACNTTANTTIYNCTAVNCGGAGFYLKYATLVWTFHPELLDNQWLSLHPEAVKKYDARNVSDQDRIIYREQKLFFPWLDPRTGMVYAILPWSWDYVSAADTAHYISHCSAIGCSGYGFDGGASVVASNLYASGNTTGPWAMSGAFTPSNSTYDNTAMDGRYLAMGPTSLSIQDPTSSYPAFYGAETYGIIIKGATKTGYTVATPGAATSYLDGFLISIPQNQCTGISASWGAAIKYCTIRGGALYGIRLFLAEAYACDVNAYGFGVIAVGERCYVNRCVLHGCTSAGILDLTAQGQFDSNTMAENYIGYWSTPGNSIGQVKDNIVVNNSIGDISTNRQVGTTCYNSANGYLTPYTMDDATGGNIVSDPLFRDAENLDYRLSAKAFGYVFDSPAIGVSSAGTDMGAFPVTYGTEAITWTTVNLGTSGWFNPDKVRRRREAIKNYEGINEGGVTYGGAVAYRNVWELEWKDVNPMPADEAIALATLYEDGRECQISFDGGTTWKNCAVLLSDTLEQDDLAGIGYANDETPRPIAKLTVRETED